MAIVDGNGTTALIAAATLNCHSRTPLASTAYTMPSRPPTMISSLPSPVRSARVGDE